MWPNPQEVADLVIFTEEILNGKLHFLCSATVKVIYWVCMNVLLTFNLGRVFTVKPYFEFCQTFKMKLFVKTINSFQPLTIFAKSSILDV